MRNTKYGHPDLLRKHEVAGRLCVTVRTLDSYVRDGRIPTVEHPLGKGKGRRVYFDWPSVARALKIPV